MDVPGLVIAVVVLTANIQVNTAGVVLLDQVVAHGAGLGIDVETVERSPGHRPDVAALPARSSGLRAGPGGAGG